MRAVRMASVAVFLMIAATHPATVNAQILDTGEGVCSRCGHSERDTQRYVNSFLNQLFFPRSGLARVVVASNLYLLSGTFTVHGDRSPDPNFDRVTISITAEVKNALPSGNYRVTVTTPGGQTSTKLYAIGETPFRVIGRINFQDEPRAVGSNRSGGNDRSGPPSGGSARPRTPNGSPAKCSHKRREDRGNETIAWCSQD